MWPCWKIHIKKRTESIHMETCKCWSASWHVREKISWAHAATPTCQAKTLSNKCCSYNMFWIDPTLPSIHPFYWDQCLQHWAWNTINGSTDLCAPLQTYQSEAMCPTHPHFSQHTLHRGLCLSMSAFWYGVLPLSGKLRAKKAILHQIRQHNIYIA